MKQPLCYIKGIEDYIAWTKKSQKSIVLANNHQKVVFEHNRTYYRGQAFSQPIFLYPPVNNYRVEYQHGAFVLSPLIKINDNHNVMLNSDPLENSCFFPDNYAIIPSSYKTVLIKELHLLGVDKETLFHGITDKIEGIIQEKLWDLDTINNIEL